MFNLEDYKNFVQSKIVSRILYYGKNVTHKYLEALYQFKLAPSTFYKDMHTTTLSKKYILMFGKTNKPASVSYNIWFLYCYGYKYCKDCDKVLSIDSFNKESHSWDNLHKKCKECHSEYSMHYSIENKKKTALYYKKWADKNRERLKEYNTAYRKQHLAEDAARSMLRYTKKLKATPSWLTIEQRAAILLFYKQAKLLEKETGLKYHVDHIVPLQGVNVCGLHVPWNLQVLSAEDNIRKSNKLLFD